MPADFDFILDEPASSPSTPTGGQTPGITRGVSSVYGFGLDSPFRRGANDFVAVGDFELINASIAQILGTRCSSDYSTGELPWRSSFGSLLYRLRHQNNDAVAAELAKQYVADAIARWEPRIRLVSVEVTREKHSDGNDSILSIRIKYTLRRSRSTANAEIYETSLGV